MSIDPIVSVESYTAIRAVPQSGGVTDVDEAARVDRTARAELAAASAAQDLSGISYLTAADREFLTYLYGPELLTDPALSVSARVGTPQFMLDLIDDRSIGFGAEHIMVGYNAEHSPAAAGESSAATDESSAPEELA